MSASASATLPPIDQAAALSEASRTALRELLLALADSKRLLGIRYSDWMLGAPTLESGIAASSMAQDEWGHGRLTYALLSDFGDDPDHLEHGREAAEYHSPEVLDAPLGSWSEMIAANLLVDTALATQYGAIVDSRYTPVQKRVQKLLDEEAFHFQHAVGWTRRLGRAERVRAEFVDALRRLLPRALRWFGRSEAAEPLLADGVVTEGPDALRARYLARIGPVLASAGLAEDVGLALQGDAWTIAAEPDWTGWDDAKRRGGGSGPDAEALARVRGDKNRAMLLD